MLKTIRNAVEEVINAAKVLQDDEAMHFIANASYLIANCYKKKGKLLIAGNGGSLCDAMHFAEELTGYFRNKRPALPAIPLSDPGHLTCVANDTSFQNVFSRGVEAFGGKNDILIVLSTSGKSENLIKAVEQAKKQKLTTIAFLGKTGGDLKGMCDLEWIIRGFAYSDRIQEAHMAAIHIIIETIEKILFVDKNTQKLEEALSLFNELYDQTNKKLKI